MDDGVSDILGLSSGCSIYLMLKYKEIETEKLLDTILHSDFCDGTVIAYACLCRLGLSQYVDGKHFCGHNVAEEYRMVYIQMGLDFNAPLYIDTDNPETILNHLSKAFSMFWGDGKEKETITNMISDTPHLFSEKNIKLVVGSRNQKGVSHLVSNAKCSYAVVNICLDNDFLEPLMDIDPKKFESRLLTRINTITVNNMRYWNSICEKEYRKLIASSNFVTKSSIRSKAKLAKYFPDVFDTSLCGLGKHIIDILCLNERKRAYILGYPIHIGIPSEELIIKSAVLLNKLGPEKYMGVVAERNKDTSIINTIAKLYSGCDVANEQTLTLDNIHNYNQYDVISYHEGGKIYNFCRESFNHITEKGKNPYTNGPIPNDVLTTINSRLAGSGDLPDCGNIKSLIENAGRKKPNIQQVHSIDFGSIIENTLRSVLDGGGHYIQSGVPTIVTSLQRPRP